MDKFSLLNLIALITIFVSLLLTFFLITVKSKNKLANILLAGFILCCAADVSGIIIGQSLKSKPELYEFIKSFTFLIFPLLYHFVLAICYSNFKLKFKSIFHALPFIFYNLLIFITLSDSKDSMLSATNKIFWISNTLFLKVQALYYLIAITYILNNYKKVYLENYSSGNIDIYRLLSRIVMVFIVLLPLTIIKDFSGFNNHQEVFNRTIMILTASALILFSWFILKALYNPEIFRGIDSETKSTRKLANRKNKNKSPETKSDLKTTIRVEQLRKHMTEKEPFLEPTLTLRDLAVQTNIPARELSVLINLHMGQHFFDFINQYRIEKATEIIRKTTKNEFTIQQILFEVGFNSKSSFNTAFKKQTRLTPSEYKNLHSKKSTSI